MSKNISKMVSLWLLVFSLTFFVGCRFILGVVCGEKPIHRAAYKGDLKKVTKIIEKDPAQINIQDKLGRTPLYYASTDHADTEGHIKVVEFLLDHGANIELGNHMNERPLAKAAKFGNYETVKILLEHGATVNCKDVFGLTPLHEAARWGGKNIISILLSYGADVDAKDEDNETPLHHAAMLNRIEEAKVLVEHGADVFARTSEFNYNETFIAAERDNNEAAKELLERASYSFREDRNKTPKEIALYRGFHEIARYLQTIEDEKNSQSAH